MSPEIEFDGRHRRLVMHGACLDLLPRCAAACCREWSVGLSLDEHLSGRFASQKTCVLSREPCDKDVPGCANLGYELRKGADGACLHLDADGRCGIYDARPQVCRDFTCRGGWQISQALPPDGTPLASGIQLDKATFVARLADDSVFVSHPLIRLHAVFYAKARREISFLKRMTGACGMFYTRDSFDQPQMDDGLLLSLIRLFDSKDTLQDVHRRFCDTTGVDLSTDGFHEIVWLLDKHDIVLDSRSFSGMLAGRGGI
jgi:Fe-S-cluster containining protein